MAGWKDGWMAVGWMDDRCWKEGWMLFRWMLDGWLEEWMDGKEDG